MLGRAPSKLTRGSIIFSPVRTEFVDKYLETAADFIERGFNVLIVDPRGQGLSDRLLDDKIKSHIEDFWDYVDDLVYAVKELSPSLPQPHVLMGHSMGGGAGFLAAENNPYINTLINFAAAETNPSAITATQNISIPTLIFSGDDDCVAPPVNHQDVMYNDLTSSCKTQIKIINGGHCYFANENVLCSFGESSCNSNLSILRNEQQEITNNFLKPWLDFSLKENQSSFVVFNDSLQASSRITYSQFCNGTAIMKERSVNELKIYPNPVFSSFQLQTSI